MEQIWLIIHFVGIILGAGAVSTAFFRDLYFKYGLQNHEKKQPLLIVTPMLNIAFGIIFLSGMGLYLQNSQEYNQSSLFWIKLLFFALLFANHIFLNSYLREKREKFKKLYNFSEYSSLLGWYIIIIISVYI